MKYINKYKTTEDFNSALSELKKLEHYLVYDEETDTAHLKALENKLFVLNYNIDESVISNATDAYGGQVPLITRCDLFKSIKVDGEEIDWSGKTRTPYVFNGETSEDIQQELNTLLMDGYSLNTNYVLAVAPEIKQGTIEVVFQDNLNPKSLIGCFSNDISITSIPKELFEILNVVNAMSMLGACSSLNSLDLSSFDTSQVTDMSRMFASCPALTNLDLSNFDTSKVTKMNYMFASCPALTSLNLSNWDTSQVTDMSDMFYYCTNLTSLNLSNWDTSQVTNMRYMFASCSALTNLDLSSFDTSQVTDMSSMFYYCPALTSLNLSNWDTSQVTDMSRMFASCPALTNLDLSNFDTSKVTKMNYMFYKCDKLNYIKCKQTFKDWCITNQTTIKLPTAMQDGGGGTWEIAS